MWFLTSPHGEGDKSVFPTDQYIIQKCFIDSPPTVFLIIAQNIPWFNHHPEFEIAILRNTDIPNFWSSPIWCHDCEVIPTLFLWMNPHVSCCSLVLATDGLSSKSKPRTMAFSTFFPENMGGVRVFLLNLWPNPYQFYDYHLGPPMSATDGLPLAPTASADPQAAVARFTEFLPVAVGLLDDLRDG